ncbi:MAG TPA: hypothetical protein VMB73_22130 [Acetobacteraceae bacterium]|jgi:hypothetical protein|nr:hypothetical protein [Acetobacteraceae bacterium]
MSILNPEHLLAQATRLIEPRPAGPPLQVDVRRAISAAYYAVFHAVLTAAADEMVGRVHRGTPGYTLVYRSVDHKALRTVCEMAQARTPPPRYRPFLPDNGFAEDIRTFVRDVLSLQERRHAADYDPTDQFRTAHARQTIELARRALHHWDNAPRSERKTLLTVLLFPPR